MTEASLEARVALGMALLDVKNPGWCDLIDLERLEIYCLDSCIIGQVYGSFTGGVELLCPGLRESGGGVLEAWVVERGFDGEESDSGYIQQCFELTEVWKAAIRERRGVTALAPA